VREAEAELARVKPPLPLSSFFLALVGRMEIAYKTNRGAEVARIYDSVRTHHIPLPNVAPNPTTLGSAFSGYGPVIGRIVEMDSTIAARSSANEPGRIRYQQAGIRGVIGAPSDSLAILERATFDQVNATSGARAATLSIASSLAFALRVERPSWPPLDTAVKDRKLQPALALARGDTAKLRAAARSLDSLLSVTIASAGVDSGFAIIAADAYLALKDSAAALATLRRALDTAMATTPIFPNNVPGMPPGYVYPRMMLLRADLAAARGQRDEARTWYGRFIDVWATAAPELQPIVERARRAHAALGT
jgi:hypothetical protein